MALPLGVLGLLTSACGVHRLDAGTTKVDAPTSFDAGEAARERELWPYGPPSNSFDLPCTLPAPPELSGTWQGQFDTYKLASGSRTIQIDVNGAYKQFDGLCGTVTFGERTAPPIATDPEAPPPGEPAGPDQAVASRPLEGFPYEFHQPGRQHVKATNSDGGFITLADAGLSNTPGAVDGDRVLFAITTRQVFKSWCNLQFSYLISSYDGTATQNLLLHGVQMNCIPPTALNYAPGGTDCPGALNGISVYGVSCAQASYCVLNACDCEYASNGNKSPPHGCTVHETGDLVFNLLRNGSELSGAMGVQGVHLTRTAGAN